MFTVDFAADFSGLSESRISALEKKGILKPERHGRSRYYTYPDIYVLRIFKILLGLGIRNVDISAAYEYLKDLKPDQPLSSFSLLHDNRKIYAILDSKELVNASAWGQRILEGTIQLEAIGSELERLRKGINDYVSGVKKTAARVRKTGIRVTADDLDEMLAS